jgi:hypothetical protein
MIPKIMNNVESQLYAAIVVSQRQIAIAQAVITASENRLKKISPVRLK